MNKEYANKFDNRDEMERFLETENLPRLNHEGKNPTGPTTCKDTESITKTSQQLKAPELVTSPMKSTKHVKNK